MRVLLVEDDEFKASDIIQVILEIMPQADVQRASSVNSALRAITNGTFSLVILDMSLPTFDLAGVGGGGSPQGQGGLEVLRLARKLGSHSPFVVVSQYPDVEINGRDIPLSHAAKTLAAHFEVEVKGCVQYEFDGDAWRTPLRVCVDLISKVG